MHEVLKDLRWCIRHHSSVEKSAGLWPLWVIRRSQVRFQLKTSQLKSIWICANRRSNKGFNLARQIRIWCFGNLKCFCCTHPSFSNRYRKVVNWWQKNSPEQTFLCRDRPHVGVASTVSFAHFNFQEPKRSWIFRGPESWDVPTKILQSIGPEHAWYKWLAGSKDL